MVRNNIKHCNESNFPMVDYDAVSLYPSAISQLYLLEGKPQPIEYENLNTEYLLKHLFSEGQVEPTKDKFISGFFVEIEITKIGKKRAFPLIVVDKTLNPDLNVPRSSNTCCIMHADHITLQDLIEFHKIECNVIRGYYYNEKRDYSCQEAIKYLFELRKAYKNEKDEFGNPNPNPAEQVIKLILNSVYGKTILKNIDSKIVFKKNNEAIKYLYKNWNTVKDYTEIENSDFVRFNKYKPFNQHFNFAPFGINILSMSKRIMNRVFAICEDNKCTPFYQDTDSIHVYEKDLPTIKQKYFEKYNKKIEGKDLCQFHSDFAEMDSKAGMPVAIKSYFLGKKSYIDMLKDKNGNIGFHARMKGITVEAIENKAKELYPKAIHCKFSKGLFIPEKNNGENGNYDILKLYKYMYKGKEVLFDLCKGRPAFIINKNSTVSTRYEFIRKLKF